MPKYIFVTSFSIQSGVLIQILSNKTADEGAEGAGGERSSIRVVHVTGWECAEIDHAAVLSLITTSDIQDLRFVNDEGTADWDRCYQAKEVLAKAVIELDTK